MSATLFVVGLVLHAPDLWLGFLLAVPLMITAIGLGWRAAVPLVPVGLALATLRTMEAGGTLEVIGFGVLLLFGAAAGHNLFTLWQTSARSARSSERRARFLSEAALAMAGSSDVTALFDAMMRLLSEVTSSVRAAVYVLDDGAFRLVASTRPGSLHDERLPPTSTVGRAWHTGRAAATPEPSTDDAPHASARALALPLLVDGAVRAVLRVGYADSDAFDDADLRTAQAFVRISQEVLARHLALADADQQGAEQALIARLTNRLLMVEGAREAAAATLAEVVPGMGLEAGAVVVVRTGRLTSLAVHGPLPTDLRRMLNEGIDLNPGPSLTAWESREPQVIRDAAADRSAGPIARTFSARALAVVPVADASGEVLALLTLTDLEAPRDWSTRDRRLLDIVATSLGAVLERATLDQRLAALLDGVRDLARAEDPRELYARAARAAVRVVPGAEAASILVRSPDGFRYEAAAGFDLDRLRQLGPFSDADAMAWYRNGSDAFRRGLPRIARAPDVRGLHAFWTDGGREDGLSAARVDDIVANVCVPISDNGEVIAVLNVDSFTDPRAFGSSSMRLAEAFAHQVAAVVRQAETLEELRRSAVTDPLTGLGNRTAFHEELDLELDRARRNDHGFAILMLDLDGFKQVNDRFGHHEGDNILVRVARALLDTARGSGSVFRWGGDEFVLLLPEASRAQALEVSARFRDAVANVHVEGTNLAASVGTAAYPFDGEDSATLLRHADDLMYQTKAHTLRSPLAGAEGD